MSWWEEEEDDWRIDYSPPVGPDVTLPFAGWSAFIEALRKEYITVFQASFAPITKTMKQLTDAGIIVETQTKPTLKALSTGNTRKTYGPQTGRNFTRNGRKTY